MYVLRYDGTWRDASVLDYLSKKINRTTKDVRIRYMPKSQHVTQQLFLVLLQKRLLWCFMLWQVKRTTHNIPNAVELRQISSDKESCSGDVTTDAVCLTLTLVWWLAVAPRHPRHWGTPQPDRVADACAPTVSSRGGGWRTGTAADAAGTQRHHC